MQKTFMIILGTAFLSGCCTFRTDETIFKNPKTEETIKCGGCATGAIMVGGAIGEWMATDNARQCFHDHSKAGWDIVSHTKAKRLLD